MLEYIKIGFGVGLGAILAISGALILLGAWDWLNEAARTMRATRGLPRIKKNG